MVNHASTAIDNNITLTCFSLSVNIYIQKRSFTRKKYYRCLCESKSVIKCKIRDMSILCFFHNYIEIANYNLSRIINNINFKFILICPLVVFNSINFLFLCPYFWHLILPTKIVEFVNNEHHFYFFRTYY